VTRTIRLVRHGRSAHAAGAWVDRAGFLQWLAAYDDAGLAQDERPPTSLGSDHGLVIASDMPRAIESARHLGREFQTSRLLREAQLIVPNLSMRLPLMLWAIAIGIRWLIAERRGEWPSAEDHKRAEDAATWLDALSAEHATITVITHAAFRRILAPALERRGWADVGSKKGHHWSIRLLMRP